MQPTLVECLLGGLVEGRHGCAWEHCFLPLPCLHRVVRFTVIVGIKEFLKPLHKLKIVLELPLHQLVHWNDLGTRKGR